MHNKARAPFYLAASMLTLAAAALAGCGGATDKTDTATPSPNPTPTNPTPTTPIGVSFVQPSNNVLEANASESLSADVKVNGSAAPNGTSVTFSINPSGVATLAPVAPTTVTGVAASTMTLSSLPPSATFQVTATAISSANTATDNLTYYVRPAHNKLEVLLPAYFSATGTSSPWAALTLSAQSNPDVRITAIAKPSDGTLNSASTADATLLTALTAFKAVPGTSNKIIGYVATGSGSSGALSVADVKATIDNYIRLYPGQLDGFFLDGMSTDSARLAYFQDIFTYIKGITTGTSSVPPTVFGNPGTYPVAAYATVADTLVTYAGNAAAYTSVDPQPASTWVYGKNNSAQAMLVHTASTCTDMQSVVKNANRPRMNTGFVYATNLTIGAPWSALPTYWQQLLGTVDAINKSRTLPSC